MSNAKDKRKNYPDHFYWKHVDGWSVDVDNKELQREVLKEHRKLEKDPNPDYNAFIRKFY